MRVSVERPDLLSELLRTVVPNLYATYEDYLKYHHLDVAGLDELQLVVQLGEVELALGLVDPKQDDKLAWLRERRARLVGAVQALRRRPAA